MKLLNIERLNIERQGQFPRPTHEQAPQERPPHPVRSLSLPGIEASILQSLARGRSVVVSRPAVAEALGAEAEDVEVTGWAERLAGQHRVHWSRQAFGAILFALTEKK